MSNSTPSTEQAREIGKRGGTVNTNSLPWQQKQAIDAAVNDGRNSNTRGNK